MPADAQQAIGHGIRAKRSKSGAISFDILSMEATVRRTSDTIGDGGSARQGETELVNQRSRWWRPSGGRPRGREETFRTRRFQAG